MFNVADKEKSIMNIKQNWWIKYLGILSSLILLCSCSSLPVTPNISTEAVIPTATRMPGSWKVIGTYSGDHSIMTAGFLDEFHVATGGVIGQMGVSSDGAQTWLVTNALSDCRYGMDIISPDVIWSCGGATDV